MSLPAEDGATLTTRSGTATDGILCASDTGTASSSMPASTAADIFSRVVVTVVESL